MIEMKKIIFATFATLAMCVSSPQVFAATDKEEVEEVAISPSEKMRTFKRHMDLSQVTKIKAKNLVRVEIVDSKAEYIEIEINENLLDYFSLDVVGDELQASLQSASEELAIRYSGGLFVTVKVPYNGLYFSFDATAASSISSSVDILAPELEVEADAASKINIVAVVEGDCSVDVDAASRVDMIAKVGGECLVKVEAASYADITVNARALVARVEAFSKVEAQGSATMLDVEAEDMALFDGRSLRCESGRLIADGLSKITYYGLGEFKTSSEGLSKIKNVR